MTSHDPDNDTQDVDVDHERIKVMVKQGDRYRIKAMVVRVDRERREQALKEAQK